MFRIFLFQCSRYGKYSSFAVSACFLFSLLFFSVKPAWCSDDPLIDADRSATIDFILEQAISHGLISGGVILVGNRDTVLYTASRGKTGPEPNAHPLSPETLFDIASLTKVIATAPAIMHLLQEGKLSLLDPLTRWFPEFQDSGCEETTILNLLTHTSGLSDVSINTPTPMETLIRKASEQPDSRIPGNRFAYADINFMLLANIVQRASGTSFDRYCQEHLYLPLNMNSTRFLPDSQSPEGIAPTLGLGKALLAGKVQDANAQLLGGVAGHAGIFSNAIDISRFAAMILNNGRSNGRQVLNAKTMSQMTAPYFYNNGKVIRGLGWDIHSPFSSPRGSSFSDISFGHTGYSGSSLWIDPQHDLYVILLTIRLDYHNKSRFNQLRSDISTLSSALFSRPGKDTSSQKTDSSSKLLKP